MKDGGFDVQHMKTTYNIRQKIEDSNSGMGGGGLERGGRGQNWQKITQSRTLLKSS